MLNNEQIDQLYIFCEEKRVQYYDVQVELVDHLANAIEQKMKEEPTIHFEKALDQVYAEFGIFGFAKIVQEKEAAAYQKQRKLFYKLLRERFKWPKILLLLLLTAVNMIIFKEQLNNVLFFSLVCLYAVYLTFSILKTIERRKKFGKNKILLNQIRYNSSILTHPIIFYLFTSDLFSEEKMAFWSKYAIFPSICISLIYIAMITLIEMGYMVDREIEKRFLFPIT